MTNESSTLTQLSGELVTYLQGPRLVLVTTLDADTKWPTNNLITWVLATSPGAVRLTAEARGRIMNNLRADGRVLLTVMAHGACHCIEGTAEVLSDQLDGVSLKVGCAEVKVQAVRDVTFWGGKITADPTFDVTYDKSLKEKLDSGVFGAMRAL